MAADTTTSASSIVAQLEAFVCDNPELLELERRLGGFNVFDALRVARAEIRHSNFLAFLLDPSETHGLGAMFLRPVLMDVLRGINPRPVSPIALDGGTFSRVEVRREWRNIDLLIVCDEPSLVVVIENKIDSGEHSDQLARYDRIVVESFPDRPTARILLTPAGDEPSEPNWTAYSYRQLHDVLTRTIATNDAAIGDDVSVFLDHYLRLIGTRLMDDEKLDELCRTIYRNHRQALEVLFDHMPTPGSECIEQLRILVEQSEQWEVYRYGKNDVQFTHVAWKQINADLSMNHPAVRGEFGFRDRNKGPRCNAYLMIFPCKDLERRKRIIEAITKSNLPLGTTRKITDRYTRIDSALVTRIDLESPDMEAKIEKAARQRLQKWEASAMALAELVAATE
ncbi:MAG: PD-(D/E)XK nuclease family protein [Planctomycetota bacterium]